MRALLAAATARLPGSPVERGDVVDEVDAGREREAHDLGVAGVDRDLDAGQARPPVAQRLEHRPHARQLDLGCNGQRARPRRLAADVEDVRAAREQRLAMLDGARRIEEGAAVGEAVGRDVDDAHDPRRLRRGRANRLRGAGARRGDALEQRGDGRRRGMLRRLRPARELVEAHGAAAYAPGVADDQLARGRRQRAAGDRDGESGVQQLRRGCAREDPVRPEVHACVRPAFGVERA